MNYEDMTGTKVTDRMKRQFGGWNFVVGISWLRILKPSKNDS